jgi:hypothetical protein
MKRLGCDLILVKEDVKKNFSPPLVKVRRDFKADQSPDRAIRTEASGDFTTSPMHLFQDMSAHFKSV